MSALDDIKAFIGSAAPIIGTLIGGPVGGAVSTLVASALGVDSTPEAISQAIKSDPNALAKIRKAEIDSAVELRKLLVEAERHRLTEDTQRLLAVNATMQIEARSEHWAQWAWRPFNGFTFGITLFCNYAVPALANAIILPWLDNPPTVAPGPIPEWVFVTWAAVLGVAAAGRNKLKQVREGADQPGLIDRALDAISKRGQ